MTGSSGTPRVCLGSWGPSLVRSPSASKDESGCAHWGSFCVPSSLSPSLTLSLLSQHRLGHWLSGGLGPLGKQPGAQGSLFRFCFQNETVCSPTDAFEPGKDGGRPPPAPCPEKSFPGLQRGGRAWSVASSAAALSEPPGR
jgi:hypothetical protein